MVKTLIRFLSTIKLNKNHDKIGVRESKAWSKLILSNLCMLVFVNLYVYYSTKSGRRGIMKMFKQYMEKCKAFYYALVVVG